jgi:hypothetical protein
MATTSKKNTYYSNLIDKFYSKNDSVMEMAKVLDFDADRLVARVYTLTSRQYRDDVPVFFSSLFLNTGIISPPVKDSTSILFWSAENQPYLLPIQLSVPNIYAENSTAKVNASPSFMDKLLSLKNIQGGELLLRSLGGSYLFLKNLGDVELGTSRQHKLSLSAIDGSLNLLNDRIRADVANSNFYFGPVSFASNDDMRNQLYFEMGETADNSETLPTMSDNDLLDDVMNDNLSGITLQPTPKISVIQMGHVFDQNGVLVQDSKDGTELFSKQTMTKDNVQSVQQLSKGGRKLFTTTDGQRTTTVDVSPNEVNISVNQPALDGSGTIQTTQIGIDQQGNIICGKEGKTYDLWAVVKWFYEQRTV